MTDWRGIAERLFIALKSSPCGCTEPKYWKNEPPKTCGRCLALERYVKAIAT